MYVSPAETVDTVNISTNNFDAEQGMAGGAAITVVTKSGTNELKGSAFEFYNSDKLNATPYFFGTAAAKPDKLPVKRNIFGGTVGGPITKNKLFFFGSYEGYKSDAEPFTFFNVPSAALRARRFQQRLQRERHRCRSSTTRRRAMPTAPAARRSRTTRFRPSMHQPIARKILRSFPPPTPPASAPAA